MIFVDTLFLNEHSQLKKLLKLRKASVETLANDHCPKYSLNLINIYKYL